MATKISLQKGSMSFLTVIISYGVAAGATALAGVVGVTLSADSQAQITLAVTAGLTGLITGGLNWLKHRKKTVPPAIIK